MKFKKYCFYIILGISLLGFSCHDPSAGGDSDTAKIWLIGESHWVDWIFDIEFTRWKELYDSGCRHLFYEVAYYHGEYLNLWMESDDDAILEDMGIERQGFYYEFLNKIKQECPLTVFHGIDVGHQYMSDGKRFLEYLKNNNLQDSLQYELTLEAIEQGIKYYDKNNNEKYNEQYRENTMVKNFIREYDKLGNERIMGIFGAAHTNYNKQGAFGNYPNMAKQLLSHYGDIIYFENYKQR